MQGPNTELSAGDEGLLRRMLRQWCAWSITRPFVVLAILGILTALAAWRGAQIELDTDLKSLLPQDAPSVIALSEAQQRRRGSDLFVVAVESPEPAQTARFLDDLAERLRNWEELDWLEVEQDRSFLRDQILLFLPPDELHQIHDNLRRMVRERQGESNPLFVDLERAEDEPAVNWRDPWLWVSRTTLAELGVAESELPEMFPFLRNSETTTAPAETPVSPPTAAELETARVRAARAALPDRYQDYRFSADGTVAILSGQLRGRPTDIQYAQRVYEHTERLIQEMNPADYHPAMRAQVVGSYRSFLEVRAIKADVTTATLISLGLVFGLLVVFFRNVRSVLIVLVPLVVGIVWSLGLIELLFHRLSTLTAFVFSMLIGMGIDFGIHLYNRARETHAAGGTWEAACFDAITRTGRALLTATVTTVVSLLMLQMAHFDGFKEFGLACGLGVAICLLAAILVLPPVLGATERVWPSKRAQQRSNIQGAVALPRWFLPLAGVALACAVGGAVLLPKVEFEYNFSNLEAPPDESRIRYGSALGRNRSSTPALMLGASEAQMREVHAVLRARLEAGDPLLRGFTTIASILPDDQPARLAIIEEIAETLDRRAFRNLEGDEREMVDTLRDLTDVSAFVLEDLPEWAVRNLVEKDGSVGGMGLLYGRYTSEDAREVAAFQEAYGFVPTSTGDVRVSSNGFIISDVVRYVQADGLRLAFWVALGLVLVLALDLRRFVGVIACITTLGVAVLMTAAMMWAFDIKMGLYNMVVLPTVLGTGIDGAIHLYHRYLEEGRERMGLVMRTTGLAVLASSMTTAAGFLGLLLISHRGVITIGALAVSGIVCATIACLTVLPVLLARFGRVHSVGVADK